MIGVIGKALHYVYPPSHLRFYLQRRVRVPRHRERISRWLARRLPAGKNGLQQSEAAAAETLVAQGYVKTPPVLTAGQIEEMVDYLEPLPCYDRFHRSSHRFRVADAPANCHVAVYDEDLVLGCPHVLRVANDPSIIRVVEAYLGCKPTISNIGIWWSLPGHKASEDAELFHRDVDDWKFVKLFVYLTDVDGGAGPHVYISGSHRDARLLRIRRYEDEEVAGVFGRDRIVKFEGAAGSAFLEDTFGLHKGETARDRRRLLFQVQYSLFPVGIYKYGAKTRAADVDPYVNRLYLE